jgi:hypothetical protein
MSCGNWPLPASKRTRAELESCARLGRLNNHRYAVRMRSGDVSGVVRAVALSLVMVVVAACGGDASSDDGAAPTASTVFEGSYEIVPDADVALGLANTSTEMAQLAAAPEMATGDAVLQVYENWGSYEGTIKQNEPETYLELEDALGVFKKSAENGDAVGMQTAITEFGDVAAQYVAAHPG